MSKSNNFNPDETAKKFLSVKPAASAKVSAAAPAAAPKHVQKAYYITSEQHKQIKRRAVDRDTDASFILREAIDFYFENR